MKKALKRHGSPEAITTDGLRSYKAAMKVLGNSDKQKVGRWANRVENSHLSFRRHLDVGANLLRRRRPPIGLVRQAHARPKADRFRGA
jgi:transposase-like protein